MEITLDGVRVLKSEVVTESPQVDEIEAYEIASEQIRILGDGVVLLSYHLTLDGKCRGAFITPSQRWATSIWNQRQSRWKCAFFQQSAFKPKPT